MPGQAKRKRAQRAQPQPAQQAPKTTAWTTHPWPRQLVDGVWAPLVAGFLTLVVGGLGLLAGNLLWLFPSLGPTLYLQAEDPARPSAQIKNVIGGHFIGILAGYLAVFALGIAYEPSVFLTNSLTTARVFAAVIAIVITEGGALLADLSHPPAAATTLLIALGVFRPTVASASSLVAGVVIVALVGELFRVLRLGNYRRYGRAR